MIHHCEKPGWELGAETMEEWSLLAGSLDHVQLVSQIAQTHCLEKGAAHGRLCLPISVFNQEHNPKDMPWPFWSRQVNNGPQTTPDYIKLTVMANQDSGYYKIPRLVQEMPGPLCIPKLVTEAKRNRPEISYLFHHVSWVWLRHIRYDSNL